MATDTHETGLAAGRPPAVRRPDDPMAARLVRVVVVAVALVPIAVYVDVALHQIGYRYELEWMEGGVVEIVARVVHGQPIYTAPSLHYVPYAYTPLYFWVSAAVAKVIGIGFLPLRLVSFVASLGSGVLLFVMVRRETDDAVAGIVAAGLFAATFEVGGAWLDVGRVDSLLLLLMLAAVAVGRRATGAGGGILCGLLVFAAFMTKQSAVLALAPMLGWLVLRRRSSGVAALVTLVAAVVASTLVLGAATHGWYRYYVFEELVHQGIEPASWGRYPLDDLLRPTGWAIALGVAGMAVGWRRRLGGTAWAFWAAVAGGMVGMAYVSRLHSGGGRDVLIPAYAAIVLLAALGYDTLRRAGAGRPVLAGTLLAAVVVVQVAWLSDHPTHLIPRPVDAAGGRAFVRLVHSLPGDVVVYDHPWYETLAGKPSWAQGEAVHDVLRAGPSTARSDLRASIRATLGSGAVRSVFLDNTAEIATIGPALRENFVDGPRVFACYQCFFPPTDVALRPYLRLDHR